MVKFMTVKYILPSTYQLKMSINCLFHRKMTIYSHNNTKKEWQDMRNPLWQSISLLDDISQRSSN